MGGRLVLTLLLLALFTSPTSAQDSNRSIVLKGQVACSKCWTEDDRKVNRYGSEHDLECAVDCKAEGISTVLAVNWDSDATLYQLEYGKLKKTKTGWLDYTAKIVEVAGTVQEKDGKRYLKVDTIRVIADNPALQTTAAIAVGNQAPELILKDIAGAQQNLSGYRGKVVILNFWATWCAPCKAEMPTLIKIQNSYAPFGIQVIGASADELEKRDAIIKFVKDNQINFPIWLGATTTNMGSFGLGAALPGTIIINRQGKIIAQIRGVVSEAELKKHIDALLAEPIEESSNTDDNTVKATVVQDVKSSSVPS
ncbi:MAG: TlpA disulfide reductase family protein [Acidobacteriota bacterium]